MSESKKKTQEIPGGRYDMVALTRKWVSVIKKTDEGKILNQSELVKRAINDLTSGAVSAEDVAKAWTKIKAAPAAGEAAAERKEEGKAAK